MSGSPCACDLTALSADERATHRALGARMLDAIQRTDELPDGYAFVLDANGISLTDLGRWIALEQRCCPFLDFDVELHHDTPLTLLLTGANENIKTFIREELPRIFS